MTSRRRLRRRPEPESSHQGHGDVDAGLERLGVGTGPVGFVDQPLGEPAIEARQGDIEARPQEEALLTEVEIDLGRRWPS